MTITLISASLLGLLLFALTMNIVKYRMATKTSMGDADNPDLLRAVRAHGNLIEYAPLMLILIGLLEYNRFSMPFVLGLSIAFVLGRILHGLGLGYPGLFPDDTNKFRQFGALITMICLLVASVAGLLAAYRFI